MAVKGTPSANTNNVNFAVARSPKITKVTYVPAVKIINYSEK